jgi:hypothetical protein
MTNVDLEPTPHRFTLHGPVRIWDLAERRLSLGARDLWLAPDVPTGNLELGMEIVAKGYEAEAGARWVVDLITIISVPASSRRPISLRGSRPRS